MEYWLTLLRIHFFNVVLIILRIVLVLSGLASHVVHYRWRSRGHSSLFAGYVFALFRVECRLFVGRDYTVTSVITVVRVRFRSGHRSSQFDKVLTRDAPNVCYFLHPLREGIARETYIGLCIRFGTLLFHKLFTGHLEFHYFFEADTELFTIENKQNGRIFLYGTYLLPYDFRSISAFPAWQLSLWSWQSPFDSIIIINVQSQHRDGTTS